MTQSGTRQHNIMFTGLLLFGLTLPLSKTAGNALLLLLLLSTVFLALSSGEFRASIARNGRQPLILAFALYFLIAFAGIVFSDSVAGGYHVAKKFTSLPVIYALFSLLIQSRGEGWDRYVFAERVLLYFLAGLLVLNVVAVMTYLGIIGDKEYVLPLAPLHLHHVWFANLNAVGVYAAASLLLFSPLRATASWRAGLGAAITVGLFCLLLSSSRAAWFGLAFTIVVMAFVVQKRKRALFISIGAAAAACILLYLTSNTVQWRINSIASDWFLYADGVQQTSLGGRFLLWKASLKMFVANPVFGAGIGDFVPELRRYIEAGEFPVFLLEYNQPHNIYLFALATTGVPGLLSLLYIFYRSLGYSWKIIRSSSRERLFAYISMATAVHFMIAGTMDSLFNIQILRYAFVFIMGVCVRTAAGAEGDPSEQRTQS